MATEDPPDNPEAEGLLLLGAKVRWDEFWLLLDYYHKLIKQINDLKTEIENQPFIQAEVSNLSDLIEDLKIELKLEKESNYNNCANWELQCNDLKTENIRLNKKLKRKKILQRNNKC